MIKSGGCANLGAASGRKICSKFAVQCSASLLLGKSISDPASTSKGKNTAPRKGPVDRRI